MGSDVGTFVLGMGAQKAGTSWLHSYFRKVPDFNLGFQKEYHILDALHAPELIGRKKATIRDAIKVLEDDTYNKGKNPRIIQRAAFLADPEFYYDYFTALLMRGGPSALTCDMTPSHSVLSVNALQRVKEKFSERGVRVKVVFLMRDPVERCWSAVRMDIRDGRIRSGDCDVSALRELYKSQAHRIRTDYASIMRRIEGAFEPEDISYGFYETMFAESFIDELGQRLGFTPVAPNFDEKVNSSSKGNGVDEDLRSEIANFYAGTYRACADRFGAEMIQSIWPSWQYLAAR